MPQLDAVIETKTAGFVNPNSNRRNQHKVEEAEREIEELMKPQNEPEEKEEPKAQERPLSKEEETFKKRYGDLRRHMAEKEKEWSEKLEAQKSTPASVLPPKSEADIMEWMKKYPDVASIVDSIARKRAEELFSATKNRFDEMDAMSARNARETAENVIRKAHADFDRIKESDEFHSWADEQPKWVQDAVYENEDDPQSVIRVLDLYKVDKGMNPRAIREKQKDAARAVGTKNKADVDPTEGGIYYKESTVNKMSAKEYEQKEADILDAMRKGRFVYDLSGGAR
jgi:hypothetical protein